MGCEGEEALFVWGFNEETIHVFWKAFGCAICSNRGRWNHARLGRRALSDREDVETGQRRHAHDPLYVVECLEPPFEFELELVGVRASDASQTRQQRKRLQCESPVVHEYEYDYAVYYCVRGIVAVPENLRWNQHWSHWGWIERHVLASEVLIWKEQKQQGQWQERNVHECKRFGVELSVCDSLSRL